MVSPRAVAPALLLLQALAAATRPPPARHALPDPEQARMAASVGEYHITYPARVRRDGAHLTHDVRRSYALSDVSDDAAAGRRRSRRGLRRERRLNRRRDPPAHYRLQLAPGEEEVVLDVRPSRRLLAPGFVTERLGSGERLGRLSRPRRLCQLQGTLRGRRGSTVAVSACEGLSGYIHTGEHQYIMEPVKGHRTEEGDPRPHIVYKRSAPPPGFTYGPKQTPACSVNEPPLPRRDWSPTERAWNRLGRSGPSRSGHRSDRGPGRQRRSVSAERNVETLIVADSDVVQFYADDNIETYLLTVMNGVAQLYHDASIGNAINVILVRILVLEPEVDTGAYFNISQDGDRSLKSFCNWQIEMNPSNESHPNHHDVAVLLTRRSICGENDTCNTLGLAEVSGMCQPSRSCNINQDTGLSVSFTIAHELGHNFGMNHDGPGTDCDQPDGHRQHVMAPNLVNDVTPVVWSSCSRREITKFLDRDWGYCLDDRPTDHEYSYPQVPPGALYDAHHQCKLLYGPSASHCDMGNVCEALWCSVDGRCITKLEPAAEGTSCTTGAADATNTSTWCSAGECVEMQSRPGAVDGSWGDWGDWGACSRTCGTGVQSSDRHCDRPVPANGGKYCVGERRRYRTCNTEPCPEDAVTFRAQQCSQFNSVPYQGKNYTWTPVYDPSLPCQLTCKPMEHHFTAVLSDTVMDGTRCRLDAGVCINGKCREMGCDGVLGSGAHADRCGVCHGNGSLCHTVRDTFRAEDGDGYVTVVAVPAGARSISMEEEAETDENSFLAVTGLSNGSEILNANWFIQWSGEYPAGGSVLYYLREENNETIFIPGPLKSPLLLKVLLRNSGTRVRYEYTEPGHEGAEAAQVFSWRQQHWSECSVACGGGQQTSIAVCMEDEAGRVEDIYCSGDRPETKTRPCNTEHCPARWWTGPWQECAARCGKTGRRRRSVVCVRSSGSDEMLALAEDECAGQPRPPLDESCRKPASDCRAEWQTGDWNKSCGDDPCQKRTRRVWCPTKEGCGRGRRPASLQYCDLQRCQQASQRRRAHRRRRPHSAARDSPPLTVLQRPAGSGAGPLSALRGRSAARLLARLRAAPAPGPSHHHRPAAGTYSWQLGSWGECGSLCGEGVRNRSVACLERGSQRSVELSRCPLPVPPVYSTCTQPCLEWEVGPWSPCSTLCGPGLVTRQVTCPAASRCDRTQRPPDALPCWEQACAQWQLGAWGACSGPCGGSGLSRRSVVCTSLETGRPAAGCPEPRPHVSRACSATPCPAARRR